MNRMYRTIRSLMILVLLVLSFVCISYYQKYARLDAFLQEKRADYKGRFLIPQTHDPIQNINLLDAEEARRPDIID
ncbi:hypothetical protein [Mangrovibacterium lignilyticum]|uniref:hypothetical protein n=1 Tax=Mangrovibacterium lignilyticum TaxID=2668052 RepID=UPI0013D8B0A3|nr:hypothetical protein [Mangrovibacterium lignilyticum]